MGLEETLSKIVDKLTTLESLVHDLTARVSALEGGKRPAVSVKVEPEIEHTRSPSDVLMKEKMGESPVSAEGRIKCPKCNSISFNVQEDKEHPVSYIGGKAIYTKKYSCKKCGNTWT